MSQTILVVGGTGTVGHNVAANLAREGQSVRVATRDPQSAKVVAGAKAVRFAFQEPSTYQQALEGVDRVFLLSPPGYADAFGLVAPFVEAAARSVNRFVLMTASGVEADESIPLRQVERAVERTGKRHVIIRPTWFMDNFHTFWVHGIKTAGTLALPAGDAKTAFVDARDIADVATVLLRNPERDGEALTVTGGQAFTYAEAATILGEAAGRQVRYQPVDDSSFSHTMIAAGIPAEYAAVLVALFQAARSGSIVGVNDTVQRVTGHAPRTLHAYARDFAAAWRAA